jgi:hypothetical protein
MVTGGIWTPETDFVRDMYNLGRYVDDTKAGLFKESTSQGERESEFDRWLAGIVAGIRKEYLELMDEGARFDSRD